MPGLLSYGIASHFKITHDVCIQPAMHTRGRYSTSVVLTHNTTLQPCQQFSVQNAGMGQSMNLNINGTRIYHTIASSQESKFVAT